MLALWGLSKVVKLLESRGSIGRGNDSLDMSGSAGYFVIGKGTLNSMQYQLRKWFCGNNNPLGTRLNPEKDLDLDLLQHYFT